MGQNISRVRIFDSVGLGMGFAAMLMAAGAVFGGRPSQKGAEVQFQTIGGIHTCTIPVLANNGPPGCEAEAAGYAAALHLLGAARTNADEAYLAWYRCEHGGQDPVPTPSPPTPQPISQSTVSILER